MVISFGLSRIYTPKTAVAPLRSKTRCKHREARRGQIRGGPFSTALDQLISAMPNLLARYYWLGLAAFPAAGEPLLAWEDFG
jgi:hypothetical protein